MDCSRRNYAKLDELNKLYNDNLDKFALIHIDPDGWLFSHAGIYKEWMDKYEFTLEDLNLKTFLESHGIALEDLSWYRGGYNPVGSCVWADLRESLKHELIPGYKQIVGHTQLDNKPYITDNIACLDVRRCFILDTLTGDIYDA